MTLPENIQTFSQQSAGYARHRPTYPRALFVYLASLAAQHARAWDCASGNGQAALSCAEFFAHVDATDISAAQITAAAAHARVTYAVGSAEHAPFTAESFDLLTVAQALHWFDLERFYAECLRVLKPGGVLAAWGYAFFEVEPALDAVIAQDLLALIEPFWADGNRRLIAGYPGLTLPVAAVADVPRFAIEVAWNLAQMLDYMRTWSAVKRYIAAHGHDPVSALEPSVRPLWGAPEAVKGVRMPLVVRVGRKAG